eukprot:6226556-Pyramimonas_sp.AAC.1
MRRGHALIANLLVEIDELLDLVAVRQSFPVPDDGSNWWGPSPLKPRGRRVGRSATMWPLPFGP